MKLLEAGAAKLCVEQVRNIAVRVRPVFNELIIESGGGSHFAGLLVNTAQLVGSERPVEYVQLTTRQFLLPFCECPSPVSPDPHIVFNGFRLAADKLLRPGECGTRGKRLELGQRLLETCDRFEMKSSDGESRACRVRLSVFSTTEIGEPLQILLSAIDVEAHDNVVERNKGSGRSRRGLMSLVLGDRNVVRDNQLANLRVTGVDNVVENNAP